MRSIKRIVVLLGIFLSCFVSSHVLAAHKPKTNDIHAPSPWFTGPLLAGAGHTIPSGHTNYEPYVFYTDSFGFFNNQGKETSTLNSNTLSPTMIITHGLSPSFDIATSIPFDINWKGGQNDQRFGDVSISLGYQLVSQKPGSAAPDVRLVLQEAFPTGHYENLNPMKNGTDSTGTGSYQTVVGVNFQRLWHVSETHFLRGRLTLSYTIPASVRLSGFNAFGGGFNTNGKISLGGGFTSDLSFEYTLTQHWVPAVDFLYTNSKKNTFTGNPGMTSSGLPAMISLRSSNEFSIAPAIEYNFSGNLGLIVGGWFAVAGHNSSDFNAAVFALNYYS